LRTLVWGLTALAAAGCGGSSRTGLGTLVVTLGDTSGDFASYIVGLASLTLTQSNGQTVTVLAPATAETVDLVRLTDVSELVSAPAVPAATYTSATVTLDFGIPASVWINVNGQAVLASAVDHAGNALGVKTAMATFDPAHPLVITESSSTRLAIDVDLAASNSISTATTPPTVTVQPFVVMTAAPADATLTRARGLFVTAQTGSSNFIMNLRPFSDELSALGAVTVTTSAQTYFNIDGVAYSGAAGLAALARVQLNTVSAAFGTLANLSGITPTLNATAVYAGTSLESPLADHLSGIVAARSGNTLTLRGATYLQRLGTHSFANSATVTVGSSTVVSEDGVAATGLTPQSVSVGQLIDVSGQGSTDSSGNISLDASAGQLRMAATRLWGTLNSATTSSASLNLLTLGNFAPAGFTFAGTGTAGQDANPAAYVVNTGSTDESTVSANTLLQLDGLVTPFGSAPPDFNASAITPGTATQQELVVEWGVNGGSTGPFMTATSAGLVVNLADAALGSIHYIRTGPAMLDLTSLPASPTITTVGAAQGDLRLAVGSTATSTGMSVFTSASAFATGLNNALNGTNKVYRLVAVGQYNIGANTFVATRISVALHD
jgi:hypothetical protein